MRRSNAMGLFLAVTLVLWLASGVDAAVRSRAAAPVMGRMGAEVKALELTDLCLFTEARYTRHLSQADRNTPFQDHPFSFDHFPTGSLVAPPQSLQ